MFTEHFLGDAPSHIKGPQIEELKKLSTKKLEALLSVKKLPIRRTKRNQIAKVIGNDILNRLEKRYKIALDIKNAEEEGLYDASEHLTSDNG